MDNVRWVGSPNFTPGRSGVTHITLHIMAGFLAGTDRVFSDPGSQTSATYGIGRDGAIHQYVSEDDTAWSDGNAYSNASTISIEHEGGIPEAVCTDECMDASARLIADIARRQGWTSLIHDGTKGNIWLHREVPGSTHTTCPDLAPNGLDVDRVIDKANQYLGGQSPQPQIGADIMAIVYGSDNFKGLKYWDGVNPPVGIQSNNHLSCLRTAYKEATGRDLPLLTFNGAWGVVFEQAAIAASQQRDWELCKRIEKLEKKIDDLSAKK